MSPDRRQRLEELPGWSRDRFSDQWEEGLSRLKDFSERQGHCRVPYAHECDDGYRLGPWVGKQRANKHRLKPDRRQRLESLPGWSWDPFSDQWEEGFSRLRQFSERQGHCRVPRGSKTDDGNGLGGWIVRQRTNKEKISPDRRQRLESLPGWSWDARSELWEEGFSHLKQFSEREGHCLVPTGYETDGGYWLGTWISAQRRNMDTMKSRRRQRLEALPGWSWDALSEKWEKGFSHLKRFSEREGHCLVPRGYETDGGYRLDQWVSIQRTTNDTMEPPRRQRLESLPGWSWDVRSDQWEQGYSHLKDFSDREGHCRVAQDRDTDDGYRLGRWVSRQRSNKKKMSPDCRQRLEALFGWSWDPHSDQWEEGFAHLKMFWDRDGHCRVPSGYRCNDDYRLGMWVAKQREKMDRMASDRRQRLEALPGWVWRVKN
jgi:hypothetical protein